MQEVQQKIMVLFSFLSSENVLYSTGINHSTLDPEMSTNLPYNILELGLLGKGSFLILQAQDAATGLLQPTLERCLQEAQKTVICGDKGKEKGGL